jgi:pimeloyl-[acyl-carrier protein] methyl ester esterase
MQVIAMHGWCGDQRGWEPWRQAAEARGWIWQSGERGYGGLSPHTPSWRPERGARAVIIHSLGLHLLPAEVLAEADRVVLLASFAAFVPPGVTGRRLRTALGGMAAALRGPEAGTMLQQFLAEAAAPQSVNQLPIGPGLEPLSEPGRSRLEEDLQRLAATESLPNGFPRQAAVLIVEAGLDRIVAPESSAQLRSLLPDAEVWRYADDGHCLLETPLVQPVLDWLARPHG